MTEWAEDRGSYIDLTDRTSFTLTNGSAPGQQEQSRAGMEVHMIIRFLDGIPIPMGELKKLFSRQIGRLLRAPSFQPLCHSCSFDCVSYEPTNSVDNARA